VDGEAEGRRPGPRPRVVGGEQKVESVPVLGFVADAVVDRIDPADRQIGEGLTDGDRALVPGILSAAGPGVARIGQAGIITVAVAGRVAVAARIPVAGWVTVAGRIAVAGLIPIAGLVPVTHVVASGLVGSSAALIAGGEHRQVVAITVVAATRHRGEHEKSGDNQEWDKSLGGHRLPRTRDSATVP